MHPEILKPVVVLFIWTMVMWVWLYATRLPALGKVGQEGLDAVKSGEKTLDQILPAKAQWKAHNYNHLHEAPTVFYAVALTLALLGAGDGINATIAWAYVGLRIVHSVIQSTLNHDMGRFLTFTLSTFALMALIVRAAMVAFA
jgi:hypothetical protein